MNKLVTTKYTLTHSSRPPGITLTSSTISVPAYSVPPNASQPGATDKLDTLDSRFINASTQIGHSLFQVHTINVGSFPTPKWYELNTTTNTVIQSGTFHASGSSHDWNASIAASVNKDFYVTWSSTCPASPCNPTVNAQVWFSGRRATDAAGVMAAGTTLFTSPAFYNPSSDTVERWGDYPAVTVDPSNPLRAWIVNEKINSASVWGTRIGQIGY